MASYSLFLKPSGVKELEVLPLAQRRRVVSRIRGLATERRPHGAEKLSGDEKYRVRQGTYRVLCTIDNTKREVVVVKIAHRRDVYRCCVCRERRRTLKSFRRDPPAASCAGEVARYGLGARYRAA